MAIVKVTNSKASIGKAINYVTQEEKTEQKLISGINCTPETALDEMNATKEQFRKTEGRQYAHYIHSFKPGEKLTHEQAHKLALELSEKQFKGYEVLVATHKDKDHIHSHIIVNSVSYEDGRKLHSSKKDLADVKELSNKICEREGLSITKPQKDVLTSFNAKKYKALEKGYKTDYKSYMLDLWRNVNNSKEKAMSKEQFVKSMEDKGYKVNWSDTRKHVTFETPEGKKVRATTLAETFKNENLTKEGLLNEFERNGKELSVGEALDGIHGKTQEDSRATTKEIDGTGKEDIRTREQIRENGDIETELGTESRRAENKEQNNELSKKVEDKPKIDKDDEFMQQYLEQQRRRSLAQKRDREKARHPGQRRTKTNDFEI